MTTVAVRLPDDLIASIDRLIAKGNFQNRTQAVKAGLAAIIEDEARREIDRRLIEGYAKFPETDEEVDAARDSTRALISEEPW